MLSIFNMFNDSEKGNNIMARTKTSKTTKSETYSTQVLMFLGNN